MGFNTRNKRGNTKYQIRAKQIYEFALSASGNFGISELPGRKPYDSEAMSLLIERGLIGYGGNKVAGALMYRLNCRVPLDRCLELNSNMPFIKGCKIYRVDPVIAVNRPTAENLEQYAIGEVTQW